MTSGKQCITHTTEQTHIRTCSGCNSMQMSYENANQKKAQLGRSGVEMNFQLQLRRKFWHLIAAGRGKVSFL